MKKLLFIAIFLPFTASAAWWNPFSWFDTPEYQTASTVEVPVIEPTEPEETESEPEIIEVIKEVEKPVIKEVVKTETITVTDPALQKRINELVAENNALRANVPTGSNDSLQNQLNFAQSEKNTLEKKNLDLTNKYSQCMTDLNKEQLTNGVDQFEDAIRLLEAHKYEFDTIVLKLQNAATHKEMGAMRSAIESLVGEVSSIGRELNNDTQALKTRGI